MHPYCSKPYALAMNTDLIGLPSQNFILKKAIANTDFFDACSCYPVYPITDQDMLGKDIEFLYAQDIVSWVFVSDVFFSNNDKLAKVLDHFKPFKTHYLYNFSNRTVTYSNHHRRKVKKSQQFCNVQVIRLRDYLEEWFKLYQHLTVKHNVNPKAAFPFSYFEALAAMDDFITIGAFENEQLTSAHIWLQYNGYVYAHLAASNDRGYATSAAYAIYDFALHYFNQNGAKIINLGGAAGTENNFSGLSFVKKGFSNQEATAYICGKILQPEQYQQLTKQLPAHHFFPAYRGTT
jgi:hypothetical protein